MENFAFLTDQDEKGPGRIRGPMVISGETRAGRSVLQRLARNIKVFKGCLVEAPLLGGILRQTDNLQPPICGALEGDMRRVRDG